MDLGQIVTLEKGKGLQARGVLEASEEFFQDHFPDFPILPGVLMLEILSRNAARYFGSQDRRIEEVLSVKYSRYLKPGDAWEAVLELESDEGSRSCWKGRLLKEQSAVCTARFILTTII